VTYIPRIQKEIVINAEREDEIRIAITEDNRLVELFIETPETERHVGDIFLGRLAKVIPGMNAAFVDVGLEQDAFLHFSDVGDSYESSSAFLSGEEVELKDDDDEEDDYLVEEGATAAEQKVYRPRDRGGKGSRTNDRGLARANQPAQVQGTNGGMELRLASQKKPSDTLRSRGGKPIPTLLGPGVNLEPDQPILVQVTREAFANKGVRVTSRISLPGRFLVLVPFEPGIGISRKVYSVRERTRLRRIVRSLKPRELGVIIRTVAENKEESALKEDLQRLLDQWHELEKKVRELNPPQLVYQDSSLTSSVMRDLFTPDITSIVIDSKKMHREVMDYVEWAAPNLTGTVELYRGNKPIFDNFNIESQIEQTLTRKIPMPSGGYLFIEHTEAMVVIDVNSGRYAARREQELNSLKTNLEAAREVARQIRLRDIGGIIVIDFIDMSDEKNRKKIYDEMKKELRKDRAKSSVLPLTEFGLMQITRQRIRQSIVQSLSDKCPVCGGTGQLVSRATILRQIERWLERFRASSGERKLTLKVHPTLGHMLTTGLVSPVRNMQMKFLTRLKLEQDEALMGDDFRFYSPKQKRDITTDYSATGVDAALADETVESEDVDRSEQEESADEPHLHVHREHHDSDDQHGASEHRGSGQRENRNRNGRGQRREGGHRDGGQRDGRRRDGGNRDGRNRQGRNPNAQSGGAEHSEMDSFTE
jgi:ribonuclease G